jgi:hypothetical protein
MSRQIKLPKSICLKPVPQTGHGMGVGTEISGQTSRNGGGVNGGDPGPGRGLIRYGVSRGY